MGFVETRNFWREFTSRPIAPPPTPQQQWESHTSYLRNLATSQFGVDLAERFDVPEVEEAEKAFYAALAKVDDPEVRNAIDLATGKISRAYQILGFCAGHFSQDSRARNF